MDDFFSSYFRYTEQTEPPCIYHRWCAISTIAAILGRNFHLQHGHFRIYPNIYTMLIGGSGTRKSTAIKLIKKLLVRTGYETIAADKTSKEKFLVDLEGREEEAAEGADNKKAYDKILEANLWGDSKDLIQEPREVFVMADEFNEFSGSGNLEFYTTLGNLWDWDDDTRPFTQRLKNSRSVSIFQPTINILGGNTPENYSKAFPPEIIGQGFLRRLLHIYGEKSDKSFAFPPEPAVEATAEIVKLLQEIRSVIKGKAEFTQEASAVLEKIYPSWQPIDDVRFASYSNSRFTQLLKLTLVVAAARKSVIIDRDIVIYANTILSAAEQNMPRALGEFGKSRNSDVTQKIMAMLNTTAKPLTAKDLWGGVYKDLEKITMLGDIMQGLVQAQKVQLVKGKGWLPLKQVPRVLEYVDWMLLTEEERRLL